MSRFTWPLLYAALALTIIFAAYAYVYNHSGFSFSAFRIDMDAEAAIAFLVILGLATFHVLFLRFFARTTRSGRLYGIIVYALIPLTALGVIYLVTGMNKSEEFIAAAAALLLFLLWYPGFIVYSIPSSLPAMLPLLLHYLFFLILVVFIGTGHLSMIAPGLLFLAYLPLAGYTFPLHRRLAQYWKPARLPRLGSTRRGFTLIELLIVVAITAIMVAALSGIATNTRRLLERQLDWRAAAALAEDQLDLLRAQGKLPPPGRYPIDGALQQSAIARQGAFEVSPGPAPGLREVRVTITLRGDGNDHTISLAAILPAGPAHPTPPQGGRS